LGGHGSTAPLLSQLIEVRHQDVPPPTAIMPVCGIVTLATNCSLMDRQRSNARKSFP